MLRTTYKWKLSLVVMSLLMLQACASGSRSDFAIPGCEEVWNKIDAARGLDSLRVLIINDCANLYQAGWRLPINHNKGGNTKLKACEPAWNKLEQSGQLDNVKFLVTHNCPEFYRHGWILPPR